MVELDESVMDSDMPCGGGLKVLEIVRYDDNKLILRHTAKKVDNLLRGLGVQVSRRLVCKDNRAVLRKGTGDNSSLLLSARELTSLMLQVGCKSNLVDKLHGTTAALPSILNVHEGKLHVLKNCEAVDYVIILEDEGYVFFTILLPIGLEKMRRRLALDIKLALLVGIHTADNVKQGGLTRARLTRNAYELARIKGQIHLTYTNGDVLLGNVYFTNVF